MRFRIWTLMAFAILLVVAVSCVGGRSAQGPVGTPIPTKTLRPTFTHTPLVATAVPPSATPAPTATPEAPTATLTPEPTVEPPTPTPQPAAFTVRSATVNVRSGPGTGYARIGQLRVGQSYEITGKNAAGDWWQFAYNGDPAWVAGQMVQVTGGEAVEVADNIPAPPTPIKRQPQAAPKAAAPTAAPKPAGPTTRYAVGNGRSMVNTNDRVTVFCRVGNIPGDSGTMRVMRGGAVLAEQAFGTDIETANTGMSEEAQYNYNKNCKVEISPAVGGEYTAVLIEGGQPISDVATFTVGGDTREFQIRWVRK